MRFTADMATMRVSVATWCRETRHALGVTQEELARAVGISRTYLTEIETGRANPTLATVDRLGAALDTSFELVGEVPILLGRSTARDRLHARCSGYVHRRLAGEGLEVAREVPILDGRMRGWIDLLAFDRRTGTMFIVEIKTGLDDIGAIERQLGWYERTATTADVARSWPVRHVRSMVLILATAETDSAIARQREMLSLAFPARAVAIRSMLDGAVAGQHQRALALIDPHLRRREWLISARTDGRRSPAPYADRAAALRLLEGR